MARTWRDRWGTDHHAFNEAAKLRELGVSGAGRVDAPDASLIGGDDQSWPKHSCVIEGQPSAQESRFAGEMRPTVSARSCRRARWADCRRQRRFRVDLACTETAERMPDAVPRPGGAK